jgi:hypothetical protein
MNKKRLKLFFFVLLLSLEGYNQNLTFNDLKYLLENNVESSDNYITKKGYKYHEAQKSENDDCDAMIWSFDRNTNNDNAQAFIAKYCYEPNIGFIWYQLGEQITFDKIKEYCKSIGFILTKTETSPFNDLCSTYENTKYKIEFCSGLEKNTNRNSYTITLKLKKASPNI